VEPPPGLLAVGAILDECTNDIRSDNHDHSGEDQGKSNSFGIQRKTTVASCCGRAAASNVVILPENPNNSDKKHADATESHNAYPLQGLFLHLF